MIQTAHVECEECRLVLSEVSALSRSELCALVPALVAAVHATQPHCNHTLRAVLPSVRGVERDLTIRCLHSMCGAAPPLSVRCPIELAGAVTLVFHTSHEGHPIELTFDGLVVRSPTSDQNPVSKFSG